MAKKDKVLAKSKSLKDVKKWRKILGWQVGDKCLIPYNTYTSFRGTIIGFQTLKSRRYALVRLEISLTLTVPFGNLEEVKEV